MKLQLFFLLVLLSSAFMHNDAIVSAEESDYKEIGEYKYLGGNLYEKKEQLFFVTERLVKGDSRNRKYESVYLKRFYFYDEDKEQLDPLLSEVIDRDSWKPVSKLFYRDKKNLYCFSPSSDGGYLNYLEGINPDSLKFIQNDGWQVPKKENRNSFSGDYIRNDYNLISWYSSDGKSIFYRCRKLELADVNSFQLITDEKSKWTAEDKYFFYDGGRKSQPKK